MARKATVTRTTGETDIRLTVDLDGSGAGTRTTGVGFFDHMLDLVARHGLLDLDVDTKGDTQTGSHHTVEDTGIVLGQAISEALGDRSGITRYGNAVIPMDEALARCAIDLSGRPFAAVSTPQLVPGVTGGFGSSWSGVLLSTIALASEMWMNDRPCTRGMDSLTSSSSTFATCAAVDVYSTETPRLT